MKRKKIWILGIGIFLLSLLLYLLSTSIERFQNHIYHVEDMKVDSIICEQYELYYQRRNEKIYTDCQSKIQFKVNESWVEGAYFLKNHSMSMQRVINLFMSQKELIVTKSLEQDMILYEKENIKIVQCFGEAQKMFYIGNRKNASQICLDLERK